MPAAAVKKAAPVKLTRDRVEAMKPASVPREVRDALVPGLRLLVQPSGHRSWLFRYSLGGTYRKLTLGHYPAVALEAARTAAATARGEVVKGRDPAADKADARAPANSVLAAFKEYDRGHLSWGRDCIDHETGDAILGGKGQGRQHRQSGHRRGHGVGDPVVLPASRPARLGCASGRFDHAARRCRLAGHVKSFQKTPAARPGLAFPLLRVDDGPQRVGYGQPGGGYCGGRACIARARLDRRRIARRVACLRCSRHVRRIGANPYFDAHPASRSGPNGPRRTDARALVPRRPSNQERPRYGYCAHRAVEGEFSNRCW